MLLFSCHSDTGFDRHYLEKRDDGTFFGNLDNFVGVHAVMRAYFSGRLDRDYVRIELTYDEEKDFGGAKEVLETVRPTDLVAVLDVTGAKTDMDFHVEKCKNKAVWDFLETTLSGMRFRMYEHCDDPVSDQDETDIYIQGTPFVFFLGVPCTDGDYNKGWVTCRPESIDAVSEAVCRIVERFPAFCEANELPLH
ncbi:MAG: hypothetical protein ACYTHN_01970 [Planctomycetota bacterium]|jgi:hypothetical protein